LIAKTLGATKRGWGRLFDYLLSSLDHLLLVLFVHGICHDKLIREDKVNGRISNIVGWAIVIIMGLAVVIIFDGRQACCTYLERSFSLGQFFPSTSIK
jgi:hypothetical protein